MEAQIVSQIKKNETEEIRIATRSYKNRQYLDIRLFFQPSGSEEFVPSKKGITFGVEFLPSLKEALEKAEEMVSAVS